MRTIAMAPVTFMVPMSPAVGVKDRKSTRLNSSHLGISYAVFCLKKKTRREGETLCTVLAAGSLQPITVVGTPRARSITRGHTDEDYGHLRTTALGQGHGEPENS